MPGSRCAVYGCEKEADRNAAISITQLYNNYFSMVYLFKLKTLGAPLTAFVP